MKTMTALLLTLLAACSSSTPPAPDCQIIGTYSDVDIKTSGDCQVTPDPTAYTISANGQGWDVEIQGLSGTCPADTIPGQCKIQGKCDLTTKDPTDPARSTGTLQFSLTFDASGFKGSQTLSLPPLKALPKGCNADMSSVGSRK